MATNEEHMKALEFLKEQSTIHVERSLKKLTALITDGEALTFTKLNDWAKEYETQRERLHNVERCLNSHEAGCYKFDVLAMPTHATFKEALKRDLGDFFDNVTEPVAAEAVLKGTGAITADVKKPKAKGKTKSPGVKSKK